MKYTLVGVDGNAFAIMGYVQRALKAEGLYDQAQEMEREAIKGDYDHLLRVCTGYLDVANRMARLHGKED